MANVDKWANDPLIVLMPNKSSSGAEWVAWHEKLKKELGKKNANEIWLKAWEYRGGTTSDADTAALRKYMDGEGVSLDKTTIQSLTDFGGGTIDSIEGIFSTGKTFILVTGCVILGGAALLMWGLFKNPVASLKAVGEAGQGVGAARGGGGGNFKKG